MKIDIFNIFIKGLPIIGFILVLSICMIAKLLFDLNSSFIYTLLLAFVVFLFNFIKDNLKESISLKVTANNSELNTNIYGAGVVNIWNEGVEVQLDNVTIELQDKKGNLVECKEPKDGWWRSLRPNFFLKKGQSLCRENPQFGRGNGMDFLYSGLLKQLANNGPLNIIGPPTKWRVKVSFRHRCIYSKWVKINSIYINQWV
jgi:hypothetical protein